MKMDKVAIHCETKEDWRAIRKLVAFDIPDRVYDKYCGDETCVALEDGLWTYSDKVYFEVEGYEIITAKEYLLQNGSATPLEISQDSDTQVVDTTNPKQALGLSNVPMNLLSPLACAYGSLGKLNGKLKYGGSNFIGTEVIMSIYMDAVRRHLDGIMAGEEFDPTDGVPHFGAMLANIDIILCARAGGTLIDDRPLLKGYREEMDKLKPIVSQLQELHKDKKPFHYLLKDSL